MESALSPRAIDNGGGVAYLDHLAPSKDKYKELYQSAVQDGRGLVEIFNKPPLDPLNPVSKINGHLKEVEEGKQKIDALWAEAWGRSKTTPTEDSSLKTRSVGVAQIQAVPVKKVNKKVGVVTQNSDRFSELEEEAYEVREGRVGVVWKPLS